MVLKGHGITELSLQRRHAANRDIAFPVIYNNWPKVSSAGAKRASVNGAQCELTGLSVRTKRHWRELNKKWQATSINTVCFFLEMYASISGSQSSEDAPEWYRVCG